MTIGEATDRTSGKTIHTAITEFEQSTGQTFLLLRMDDDVWDEEAVIKMLEDTKAE